LYIVKQKIGVRIMIDRNNNLESVSARINENGRLQLIPENNEEVSVVDVAPAVKEGVDHMIANNFFLE